MSKVTLILILVITCQRLVAQEWKSNYVALEFEVPGISIEVPRGWYAMNNGALRVIDTLSAEWLKKESSKGQSDTLASLTDRADISDNKSSVLSIQFSPDVILTQRDISEANPAQKEIILEHWRETGFQGLKKLAHFARLVDNGKIIQIGSNWYVKMTMEVQMREDLPKKIKELFIHMSNRGLVMIAFTYLAESEKNILPIQDYVTESLRTNTLKRSN